LTEEFTHGLSEFQEGRKERREVSKIGPPNPFWALLLLFNGKEGEKH
jgi:hypothetical protein